MVSLSLLPFPTLSLYLSLIEKVHVHIQETVCKHFCAETNLNSIDDYFILFGVRFKLFVFFENTLECLDIDTDDK